MFSLFNMHTQQSQTIVLGSDINNSVSIHKDWNSNYTSYACNNDMHLYRTAINNASIKMEKSIDLEFWLNHSALSKDGKNLVVVGDSSEIVLLHPEENNLNISGASYIETSYESAFSSCFDSSGVHFATCFDDGACLVYDLRNTSAPIHEISSTRRHFHDGAFRNVKYSTGADDLLLLTEHAGRIHVVDTRDFSNHKVIVFPRELVEHREDGSQSFTPTVMEFNDVPQVALKDILHDEPYVSEFFNVEISGIDWYEDHSGSHFVVGCEHGLLDWGVQNL